MNKIRQSTARSIDGDETHAQGARGLVIGPIEPRAGRAMAEKYGPTRGIPILGKGDPAILELNVRFQVEAILADSTRLRKCTKTFASAATSASP
jgi:hypothetical protein